MEIKVEKPTEEKLKELDVTTWSTWEAEPSTFDWHYDEQETAYILEGEVTVKTDQGEVTFGKGDLVTFPAGLSCKWQVHKKIRKHYKFE